MKQAALFLALVALSCSTVNSGGVAAVTGDAHYDSTDAMRFDIEQISSPMTFRGNSSVDVCFRITVTNATRQPMRVRRISLQAVGSGSYEIDSSSRKFDQTIAPGERADFRYWASGQATDLALNTSAPIVVRTTVEALADGSRIKGVFNRRVNGMVAIAVGSTP